MADWAKELAEMLSDAENRVSDEDALAMAFYNCSHWAEDYE